tara:strand:+ start:2853 stop:3257 length:405 start_codon:yes stop_codon:yes gene_type:complete
MITTHSALIYAMVLSAAADGSVGDEELETISEIINVLPIFQDFEIGNFGEIAGSCIDMLSETDGLDAAVDQIKRTLPEKLRATAYALACDVVAADGTATQEELRFLEILRHEIDVDRLTAAAIERGSAARYARP